ncbi:MAG: metallophosphoesterase [Patescibacteria group bacterium]
MWITFEIIIWFYCIAVAAFLFEEFRSKKRKWLIVLLLSLSILIIVYGSLIEPRILTIDEQSIVVSQDQGIELKAVVVGDLHLGPYKKSGWAKKVVERVNLLDPDIVFLVGDYISNSKEDVKYFDSLGDLKAPLGIYAVTGNHEYHSHASVEVIAKLGSLDIKILENENEAVDVSGGKIMIAGISDIWFEGDLYKALEGLEKSDNVILLSHNPDAVLATVTKKADLVVSGHTHGGQIRLPFLGPVPRIPDALGQEYDKGLFVFKGIFLYITNGVGEIGTRVRFFNPPQVSVLNVSF